MKDHLMNTPTPPRMRALPALVVTVAIGLVGWASDTKGGIALQPAGAAQAAGTTAVIQTAESLFIAENTAAMIKMMVAMALHPSGDVDSDFVAMMIPHHQGAIEMAQAVLRYGKNEQVRRLAQEIIVTQQDEIAAMHLALGQPPNANPAPVQSQRSAPPRSVQGDSPSGNNPL
jgi:hypothetical protein